MSSSMGPAVLLLLSILVGGPAAQESAVQEPVAQDPSLFVQWQSQVGDAVSWDDVLRRFGDDVSVSVNPSNSPDTLPGVSVSVQKETTTDGNGFLQLRWQLREVANLELIRLQEGLYIVANASGQVSSKAPFGTWHTQSEGPLPQFYSGGPSVGTLVAGITTPNQ